MVKSSTHDADICRIARERIEIKGLTSTVAVARVMQLEPSEIYRALAKDAGFIQDPVTREWRLKQ